MKKISLSDKLETASRLQQIRTELKMTQEQMAGVLEISVSAYKKIEAGINQISVDNLRKLGNISDVSIDHLLLGKETEAEETWKMIMNCSEVDKTYLLLKLFYYFSNTKKKSYEIRNNKSEYKDILELIGQKFDFEIKDGSE